MHFGDKYSRRDKLAAWMLLALFLSFSTTPSLLSMEFHENAPNKHTAVGMLEYLITYNTYQLPVMKYDFGKQRVLTVSWVVSNVSRNNILYENDALQQPAVFAHFMPADIPAYLFTHVLRI